MYPENKENLPELSPAYLEEVYFFQYYDGPLHGFCIFDEEIYFYDVFEEPFHGCDSSCIFYEKCELDHKKFVEFYRKEYNKPDYDSQFKDDMCASMDRFYVLIDLDEEQLDKARRYMVNHIQNFGYSNVYTVYFQKRKKFIEENGVVFHEATADLMAILESEEGRMVFNGGKFNIIKMLKFPKEVVYPAYKKKFRRFFRSFKIFPLYIQ